MKKLSIVCLAVFMAVVFGYGSAFATDAVRPPKGEHWNVNFVTQLGYDQPLFSDDFKDGYADGWVEVGDSGIWVVELDDSYVYSQEETDWTTTSTYDTFLRSYEGDSWTNYSVEAKVKIVEGGFAPIAGIFFRVQGDNPTSGYYMFRIDAREAYGPTLIKSPNTTLHIVYNDPADFDTFYTLKVIVNGSNIQCYVNGMLVIEYMDTDDPYLSGGIGVGSFNAHAHFDDVIVMGVNPNEILIPLDGLSHVKWTFGDDFQVVDNDANVNDGDEAVVQFPWGMNYYDWWLSARGKPGTLEVNNIIADSHTEIIRSTKAPTWVVWPSGPYDWTGGVNGHSASLLNSGVTNLGLRVYPNQ